MLMVVIAVFVGLAAGAWLSAGWLVSPQQGSVGSPPDELPIEEFTLISGSGAALSGWHIDADSSQGVVVLVHGIRGSRLSMLQRARWLHSMGYSCVLFDLQAHGESTGERITLGHLEQHDVTAMVAFAKVKHPGEKVAVIAVSLGGVAALLASPLGIDALVVESVFATVNDAIHNRVAGRMGWFAGVPEWMLRVQFKPRLGVSPDQLRPIDHIADVGCPIFVLGGASDPHTPAAETEQLFQAASEPKQLWLVPDAQHEDLFYCNSDEYKKRVGQFLNDAMTP